MNGTIILTVFQRWTLNVRRGISQGSSSFWRVSAMHSAYMVGFVGWLVHKISETFVIENRIEENKELNFFF